MRANIEDKLLNWLVLATLLLMALALAGCQSGPSGPRITVEQAWARSSPRVAPMGAFYLVIKNEGRGADRLVALQSPACGALEVHETYQTAEGAMGMRPVEGGALEIPAKGEVAFESGGLHIMCIEKQVDFVAGTTLPLRLQFEESGEISVAVEIRQP